MKTVRVFISGRVQGVGFRQFIKTNAERLFVGGWVRNTEDNRVEALFQGEDDEVEKLIQLCYLGPEASNVSGVVVSDVDTKERYRDFTLNLS